MLKFKDKKTLHLIGCYGPASDNPESKQAITKINNYIEKIIHKNEHLIIAGDLNEDYKYHNLQY